MLWCDRCEGRGCEQCDGGRVEEITECPLSRITPDVNRALLAAELAEKGSWPTLAGWLDQPQVLIEAVCRIWSEQAHWRAARISDARS